MLTDLNPWVVAFHLLFSMAIISLAVLYLWRASVVDGRRAGRSTPGATCAGLGDVRRGLGRALLGTVVTGSGPHAGDVDAPRNGLDPLQLSQVHADVVFLLVGLTVALVIAAPVPGHAATLLGVELAQGLVGFVQYFTDLPVVLVGVPPARRRADRGRGRPGRCSACWSGDARHAR